MHGRFDTTRWSLVRAAQGRPTERSREALAELCRAYWPPLFAHARRRVATLQEAEDLTQGFIAELLERDAFADVNPERGRLRSYLLACFDHFVSHERERGRAQVRGGGRVISLDALRERGGEAAEPRGGESPEHAFDRAWALTVVERVLGTLRDEMTVAGHGRRHELLAPALTDTATALSHRDVATALGCSEGAVKVMLHRLRKRFGVLLRAEVAETVDDASRVDDELRHLLAALASS